LPNSLTLSKHRSYYIRQYLSKVVQCAHSYAFHVNFTKNIYYFPKEFSAVLLCNGEALCLLLGKIKVTLEKNMKAQKGVEVLLYTFFKLGARQGGWQTPRHAPTRPH
jgi:hypothetical protein